MDAFLAIHDLKVWQKDSLCCWNVDLYALSGWLTVYTILQVLDVSSGHHWRDGCVLCLPVALVSALLCVLLSCDCL